MSNSHMIMACRWGWSSTESQDGSTQPPPSSSLPQNNTMYASPPNELRKNRFAPCQGRLYHQLMCSHRIRTDLSEDCGPNCLEPFNSASNIPFYCEECVMQNAANIWEARKAQHNAAYPPADQMSKEQFDAWYDEYRRLEAVFTEDRRRYDLEVKANTRPSNRCSTTEATQEEAEFASELDTLSLSMMPSSSQSIGASYPRARSRIDLPGDASEQLHWGLNTLTLDRGSCGVEYSICSPTHGMHSVRNTTEEELWRKPRE